MAAKLESCSNIKVSGDSREAIHGNHKVLEVKTYSCREGILQLLGSQRQSWEGRQTLPSPERFQVKEETYTVDMLT